MKFWIKMVAGLIMGIIIGSYISPDSVFLGVLRVVGLVFIRLLNFLVLPLLLFSGIRAILLLRKNRGLFIIMVKTIGYFMLLTLIGAAVGMVMGDVLKPGAGVNVAGYESAKLIHYPSTSEFLLGIVPESFIDFLRSGYAVLAVLFISFLIGMGIFLAREEADELHSLIMSIDNTLHRLNIMILEFLPIGVFAYIGYNMGFLTSSVVMPYLKLILVVVAGTFIQVVIVQALMVYFLTKLNPFIFLHAVIPAGIVGFMSGNRYTAQPVLVECLEHNLGADREVFTFITGLGIAFSLSGSAVAAGVSTLFVAQAYGLDISVYLQIIIVLLITASSLKLDGLMNGSLVLLSVVLANIVRLPAEGYAILLSIAAVLSQIETVANVTGNATISCILSYSEGAVSSVNLRDFL